jgi:hypothetical protein
MINTQIGHEFNQLLHEDEKQFKGEILPTKIALICPILIISIE